MIAGYDIVAATPSAADYLRLRVAAGLSPKTEEQATKGLPNTWHGVTLVHEGRAIGMGRIIGDGGTAFQIVDIAVEPDHHGKGLGKAIMAALMQHLSVNAPAGAYVSLIADGDARHLYAKYGFEPVMPHSIGMAMLVRGKLIWNVSNPPGICRNSAASTRNCGVSAMFRIKSS